MRLNARFAAIVLGSLAAFGNPAAAADLTQAQKAEIEGMRGEAMGKLVVLDEPRGPFEAGFLTPGGSTTDFSEFGGKLVVANLWATWCPPCREEMPALDRLKQALEGSGIEVVTIAVQPGGRDKAKDFLKDEMLYALEPYADERNALPREVGILGLPTTLILDAEGREIARVQGDAPWDAPEAEAILRRLAEISDAEG